MILRRVNLPWVSYPGDSYDVSRSYLKGQSNEIFEIFFSHISSMPGPLGNGLKYFCFWLRFCQVIQIFHKNHTAQRQSPCMGYHTAQSHSKPRGVNSHFLKHLHNKYGFIFYYKRATFFNLKSYSIQKCFESPGYYTTGSQFFRP